MALTKAQEHMDTLHIWNPAEQGQTGGTINGKATKAWTESHLESSRRCVEDLLAVEGARTVQNTLRPYDRAQWHLRMAGSQSHVMFMVHPAAEVRDAAQELSQAVSTESVALGLNKAVYEALQAVDVSAENEATRYYMERILLGFRLSGVDRDEATRERVRTLHEEMTELGMRFSRTVQDDVRKVAVEDLDELRGLPGDYLAKHGVLEEEGKLVAAEAVVLTTDPPDMAPVMSYAGSRDLRRRMYLAYFERGYPQNKPVLQNLLARREELAELLQFRSWADMSTVTEMMGSAANMRSFLQEVEKAAQPTAEKEWAELEAFVRERAPEQLPLTLSDARYWEEEFRRARFNFDSQSVRPYFPYAQVQDGILAAAGRLLGVSFREAKNAAVWARGVKAFDVLEIDKADGEQKASADAAMTVVGRIYLDMHPREGKSKWFSSCSLVGGVMGEQLPEAALVCNFPEPDAHDEALMQYSDVVTYFHEFGHLMHEVLGGRQRWAGQSGIATEGDFVEVPSQMLEEFFEDANMLRTFARHYQTGEPIPYDVVKRMTRGSAHGRGLSTLTQVMYATYSMETHDRRAAELDLDMLLRDGYDRFSRYEFVDGNRMYAAFTHLIGYTSNYYTYLYDKVMALEFFGQFGANVQETAIRYRKQVLEPGGSKPARELVQAFLGREAEISALRGWIEKSIAA